MNSDNVKISTTLLNQAVNVLEYICNSDESLNLVPDFIAYAESVLWDLKRKQLSVDLRAGDRQN